MKVWPVSQLEPDLPVLVLHRLDLQFAFYLIHSPPPHKSASHASR